MILSQIIETKIKTYNEVRNHCIQKYNHAANQYEKEILSKIVDSIDGLMKSDGIEHYVFRITV